MAKAQQQTEDSRKRVRIPFVGNNQQRSPTEDKDQKFVNAIFDTTINSVTNQKKLFAVKRPGTQEYATVRAGYAGRGIWYFNNKVYSVFGDKIYADGVELETLSTATGSCGAVEFIDAENYSNSGLFVADGIDGWVIGTSGTITRVDTRHLQWTGSTPIEIGDRRVPVALGSKWYVALTNGITGTSEPIWPTTIGNTLVDGGVTWRCEGSYAGPAKFVATTTYALGTQIIPTTENGYWYEVTIAGLCGAEPTDWTLNIGDVSTSGAVTFECKGQYGGFPTPHIPSPVFMDGYIFLAEANSLDVYNSDLTRPSGWGALSFAAAESYPDFVSGLARLNNYLVAFGSVSTEFFYNQALTQETTAVELALDSPVTRAETYIAQIGALTKDCLLQVERSLLYIGSGSVGGYSVWKYDGTTPKEISTEYIEKFLDRESETSGVTGFGIRISGHLLFIINLPTANKTFVYDLEENIWSEWGYGSSNGVLPFGFFCEKTGRLLLQHKTDGKIYEMLSTRYQDQSTPITFRTVFAKQDFEVDNLKFFNQVTVIGDAVVDPISLRWSDDDYVTWSGTKILPIGTRPHFKRLGSGRRRAWEFTHTGNSALRLEAVEVEYSIGDH
jgi:hypothetical protein